MIRHGHGLGDHVERALSLVGITRERVEKWLGRKCKCKERQARLNALGSWVTRVLGGKTDDAERHLDDLMGDEKK